MLNQFYDKYIFTGGLKYTHNNFSLMGIQFAMVPVQLLLFEKLADEITFKIIPIIQKFQRKITHG